MRGCLRGEAELAREYRCGKLQVLCWCYVRCCGLHGFDTAMCDACLTTPYSIPSLLLHTPMLPQLG